MATALLSSVTAPRTRDRQGGAGTQTGGATVLDVAQGSELSASQEVWFAHGAARSTQWCEADHRPCAWAPRSLNGLRAFELVNHGRSCDRIDGWVEPSSPE